MFHYVEIRVRSVIIYFIHCFMIAQFFRGLISIGGTLFSEFLGTDVCSLFYILHAFIYQEVGCFMKMQNIALIFEWLSQHLENVNK